MSGTTPFRSHRIQRYGWIPDLPDARDHVYASRGIAKLPASADLRAQCAEVYDQGNLGSCTANAIAAAVQFVRAKQGLLPDFIPSRLWVYYHERVIEHTVNQDAGAMIRDGIKVVGRLGVCPEPDWPYDVAKFAQNPSAAAYASALPHKAIAYARITHSLRSMKTCLASGYPFVLGFTVYEAFESDEVARTGIVPMPGNHEQVLGGHAVMAVGYDDGPRCFTVRNSWGREWGDAGHFYMPYEYLMDPNLSDDFWEIRLVT